MGLGEQKDSSQQARHIKRQLGHKQGTVAVGLEQDAANDGHHGGHARQRADNDGGPQATLVQVEHVADCCERDALPGGHPEALDHAAGEQGVVPGLGGPDDADDGPEGSRGRGEEKLGSFAVFLREDRDDGSAKNR